MRVRAALLWLLLLSALYLGGLAWVDSERDLATTLRAMGPSLAPMASLTVFSWLIRFGRWQWLLKRIGRTPPTSTSLLAYLSGFAFTATPGKVGELARIRYFQPLGVRAPDVVSAFVYERVVDLVCVLVLASGALAAGGLLPLASVFVATVIVGVTVFASRPSLLSGAANCLERWGMPRVSGMLDTLAQGLSGCRRWLTPADLLISVASGLAAWMLLSTSFVVLARDFGVTLALGPLLAIYPLAMLVGAASMMPGGVGSTEAAIVLVLATAGVSIPMATLIAIGVRLTTLWLAIAFGFLALATLEIRLMGQRATAPPTRPPGPV